MRLPSTLRRIKSSAFRYCKRLKSVNFPEGLESLGNDCFFGTGVESVEFPAALRRIFQGVFARCESLRTAVLNEGLEELGFGEYSKGCELLYGVFSGSAVEHVQLPSTLRKIAYNTFMNCRSLRTIQLPDKLEHIG